MTDRKQHEFYVFYYIQDCERGSTNVVLNYKSLLC